MFVFRSGVQLGSVVCIHVSTTYVGLFVHVTISYAFLLVCRCCKYVHMPMNGGWLTVFTLASTYALLQVEYDQAFKKKKLFIYFLRMQRTRSFRSVQIST